MTSAPTPQPVAGIEPPANLGRTAARGLAWMMAQTVGVKIVSLVANVILAWYLQPGDAGLVGISYVVLSLAGIVQYVGLQDVLVQRQSRLHEWINAAFWLALCIGIIGGGITALAAPLTANWLDEPRLTGMILLLAVASPFQTAGMIPQAVLSAQLRFRAIVAITTVAAIGNSALSIVFAMLGFKSYSMLMPIPITAALQCAAMWALAKPAVHWRLEAAKWRGLALDAAHNWGVSIGQIILTTADHVVLMAWFPPAVVGVYFWAINLSTQLLRLLAMNLMGVLMPSLSRLQDDPDRQAGAFLQAARVLAAVGVPACLLQAALAEPLVRVLYKDAWEHVGAVLCVLSIGMALSFVYGPATSLLKAQGRFRTAFVLYACASAAIVAGVVIAARASNDASAAFNVAIAAASTLGVLGPVSLFVAVRPMRSGWVSLARVYATPILLGSISIAAAVFAASAAPDGPHRDWWLIAIEPLIVAILYPTLISALDREVWLMATGRIRSLLKRT